MTRTQRRIAGVAGIAVAAVAMVLLMRPAPVEVEVAPVALRRLSVTIDADGETRVPLRHVISAVAPGRFEPAGIDEGMAVRAGQSVGALFSAPLDPRELSRAQARLAAAVAARRAAEARASQLEVTAAEAQRTLDRLVRLAAQAPVAAGELDRAHAVSQAASREQEAARFQAAAAAAEVSAAEAVLEGSSDSARARPVQLRAPVSGIVLRVVEECDRIVPAGAPLVEIGDLGALEVVIEVLSDDAVGIKPGTAVWLRAGGYDSIPARVRLVEPSGFTRISPLGVEEQRVNVLANFVSGRPSLGDRYRVEAGIVLWDSAGVLSVPSVALFRAGEGWAAFVVRGNRARLAPVAIGRRGGELVQLLGGLEAGDSVVLQPGDRLKDGVRIRRAGS